jgi:hypothetical protein
MLAAFQPKVGLNSIGVISIGVIMHPVRPFHIKTISVDSLPPILNFLWLVEQSLLRFEMRRMVAWLLYLAACPEIGFVEAQLFTSALRERFAG